MSVVKSLVLLVIVLTRTVMSEFECQKQEDCNQKCSVCAEQKQEKMCIFLFPYMFKTNMKCDKLAECKDNCNNHGKCEIEAEGFSPSCKCDNMYYGFSCQHKMNKPEQVSIVKMVEWSFNGILPVGEYETLFFHATTSKSSTSEEPYMSLETTDGFLFEGRGKLRTGMGSYVKLYHSFSPEVRFPFRPSSTTKSYTNVIKLGNTVLGYSSELITSFSIDGIDYYENNFTVFVSYEGTSLQCVPLIEMENCGSTVHNPTSYTRAKFISIKFRIKYLEDGRYEKTSIFKPECAKSSKFVWKLWNVPNRGHSENVDKPIFDIYKFRPIDFRPFYLKIGTYKVLLEVRNVQTTGLSLNFAYCYFKIKGLPLVAIIDGGHDRTVSKYSGVNLSAQRSYDPNTPSAEQSHVKIMWSCVNVLNPQKSEELCKPKQFKTSDVYFIPSEMLTFGAVYNFTLKVFTNRYNDCRGCSISPVYAHVRIEVSNESEKIHNNLFIHCVLNCGDRVAHSQVLFLKAVYWVNVTKTVAFNWSYYKDEGTMTPTDAIMEKDLPSHFLLVKENSLESGAKYTIVLHETSSRLVSKYVFETDKLAYDGPCVVSPLSGTKGLTRFDIICTAPQDSDLIFEFYDKNSEEISQEVIFNGRMLGTSFTGSLPRVTLTRGNVVVYIIDSYGLFATKKLHSILRNILKTSVEDILSILTNLIKEGHRSRILDFISSIPDILPASEDKSEVLEKLLRAIIQIPLYNLADAKISNSALINVLVTLNKPTQLFIKPSLLTLTFGVVQKQASIFKNTIFDRQQSRWMSPKEVKQLSSSILTCLHAALMCVSGNTVGVKEDDFPLHMLYDLKHGSFYVEDSIEMIGDVISYIQAAGHPLLRVPSANDEFIVWAIENDRTYPMTHFLNSDSEIPIKLSDNLLQYLEKETRVEENVGLKVVFIYNNIFSWCLSDVKSNLLLVSLTRQVSGGEHIQIKNVEIALDIYFKLENSSPSITITYSAVQLDPNMTSLDKDLGISVHRIDPAPRSLTWITFMFPPTSSTLRVLVMEGFRPDYKLMEEKSTVISQQSPTYLYQNKHQEEPSFIFMGILPGMDVSPNQSVIYSFKVNTTLCQFWANGQWSSSGCQIGPDTSGEKVHCQCTHMSIFAATFPVPPQEINPFEDAKLFLTVLENPLVVILVSIVLIIYLLICLWAYFKDRKDAKLRSVIILDDNYPTDKFSYLLAVYTSPRYNAGTTARVGVRLIGTSKNSRAHILASNSRKVLMKNSDDWFLIYCPEHLGDLESIHLWHDNSGWSPEWFCKQIHVYDLISLTETVFFVDQWIELSLNEFPEVSVIPARSQDFMSLKMLFVDNLLLGLRDRHVFLSVFIRHPRNEVSRLQRVTVFMCCLMVAMLCSIMFYVPADGVTNIDDFQYEVGTRELYISIESLIISGIFTFILLFSFRKSYKVSYKRLKSTMHFRNDIYYMDTTRGDSLIPTATKNSKNKKSQDSSIKHLSNGKGHKAVASSNAVNTKRSNKDDRNPQSTSVPLFSNYSQHRSGTKRSKGSPVGVSGRQTQSSQSILTNKNKPFYRNFTEVVIKTLKTQSLPPVQLSSSTSVVEVNWFWLIFAWFFCITTIIVCSYFVMLYGLKLGLVKSKKWLASVLLTTWEDLFITGPLRIMLMAIVLSIAFQKMCDVNTHVVDPRKVTNILETRMNEEYVTKLVAKRCHPMYVPVSNDVRNAELRKKSRWNNWWNVLYFTVTTCFVFVVSALTSNLWGSHFHCNDQIKKFITLSHHSEIVLYDFNQVRNVFDFETFLGYTLIDCLYTLRWYNDLRIAEDQFDEGRYWAADYTNRMIGLPQLRQLRVVPKACGNIVLEEGKCIPHWGSAYEDKDVYGIGWTPAKWEDVKRESSPWKYTTKSTYLWFHLYRLFGVTTNLFGNGGYLAILGPSRKQAELMLAELNEHRWQDHRTKAVLVEFTFYNTNVDTLSQVTLIVEYLVTNKVQLGAQVITVKASIKLTAWFIVFIFAIVVYLLRCAYLINRMGLLGFFSEFGNVCRFVVTILGILSLIVYLLHDYTLKHNVKLFLKDAEDSYFDFDKLTHFFILLQILMTLLLFFAILLAVMLLKGGRALFTHYYTIRISIGWIFWLTGVTLALVFLLHRMTYLLNIFKAYDYKVFVPYRKSMSSLIFEELEHIHVQVFILIKTLTVNLCIGCFIVLFRHYATIARSHIFKDSNNFSFVMFLHSEILKRRKLKRK